MLIVACLEMTCGESASSSAGLSVERSWTDKCGCLLVDAPEDDASAAGAPSAIASWESELGGGALGDAADSPRVDLGLRRAPGPSRLARCCDCRAL